MRHWKVKLIAIFQNNLGTQATNVQGKCYFDAFLSQNISGNVLPRIPSICGHLHAMLPASRTLNDPPLFLG
ncbi:hypothetical protein SADUNF_Sadunf11G0019600 [Salix dunnii]|uniref:Uncharacterized protein n=1 Tax=Salix dunnii TaxID=1413687 RepID=A0A835MWL2_9ROSI|nr:hypothetical protein SADUNF_Sadunf11G0019600 [Salix dunnii]